MIVVVGLSHRTAPIDVRERLALTREGVSELLGRLVGREPIGEALIISTCNRVEVVAAGDVGPRADLAVVAEAARQQLMRPEVGIGAYLYTHTGVDAIRHLFRVASSLDSLVLGEPQILRQVKDAFEAARAAGTLGSVLNRVVPRAIRAAKRVRSETRIGSGQVSVPSVAVDLARQIFGDLAWKTAALVGSGEMGEGVARLLHQAGCQLLVTGRNERRVHELAQAMRGSPRPFSEIERTLVEADVIITTTSASHYVIDYEQAKRTRRRRKGRSLFLIDLAVPRDVDPRIDTLDGTFLYNIDDLSRVVADSLSSRQREAERAEAIVLEEAEGCARWVESEQVKPAIVALRDRFRDVLGAELERSLKGRLRHLTAEDRDALSTMLAAAVNKLLHRPTARLRAMAADGALREDLDQHLAALVELFALDLEESGDVAQIESPAPAAASGSTPAFRPAAMSGSPRAPGGVGGLDPEPAGIAAAVPSEDPGGGQ